MIRVNEAYIIEVDLMTYTVKRDWHKRRLKPNYRTDKYTETDTYTIVGYYNGLTEALKGIIDDMNKRKLSSGVFTLEEAVDIILENNKKVSDLLERALEV